MARRASLTAAVKAARKAADENGLKLSRVHLAPDGAITIDFADSKEKPALDLAARMREAANADTSERGRRNQRC